MYSKSQKNDFENALKELPDIIKNCEQNRLGMINPFIPLLEMENETKD